MWISDTSVRRPVMALVLNLILTGGFVVWVKKLALRSYTTEPEA